MAEPRRVVILCEDVAHERLLGAFVRRLAREMTHRVYVRSVSARGGRGRAMSELSGVQRMVQADLLVVGIDANCQNWTQVRSEIERRIDKSRFPAWAVACPDPHIEQWYLADPQGLQRTLGLSVSLGKAKCQRDYYKHLLHKSLADAGHVVTLGGPEFASEIVDATDLYRAGRNEPSLKHWLDDVRSAMQSWPK